MKVKDPSLLRQFLLYFILPVIVIIIASIIGVRLLAKDSETVVVVVNSPSGGLGTEEISYLYSADDTATPKEASTESGTSGSDESKEVELSTTVTPSDSTAPAGYKNILLYIGVAICGVLIIAVIGAGVFLVLLPEKKS